MSLSFNLEQAGEFWFYLEGNDLTSTTPIELKPSVFEKYLTQCVSTIWNRLKLQLHTDHQPVITATAIQDLHDVIGNRVPRIGMGIQNQFQLRTFSKLSKSPESSASRLTNSLCQCWHALWQWKRKKKQWHQPHDREELLHTWKLSLFLFRFKTVFKLKDKQFCSWRIPVWAYFFPTWRKPVKGRMLVLLLAMMSTASLLFKQAH